ASGATETVSTVFYRVRQTVETVFNVLPPRYTPLKRGVNQISPAKILEEFCRVPAGEPAPKRAAIRFLGRITLFQPSPRSIILPHGAGPDFGGWLQPAA